MKVAGRLFAYLCAVAIVAAWLPFAAVCGIVAAGSWIYTKACGLTCPINIKFDSWKRTDITLSDGNTTYKCSTGL